jgi:hypothetical protein
MRVALRRSAIPVRYCKSYVSLGTASACSARHAQGDETLVLGAATGGAAV